MFDWVLNAPLYTPKNNKFRYRMLVTNLSWIDNFCGIDIHGSHFLMQFIVSHGFIFSGKKFTEKMLGFNIAKLNLTNKKRGIKTKSNSRKAHNNWINYYWIMVWSSLNKRFGKLKKTAKIIFISVFLHTYFCDLPDPCICVIIT